MSNDALLDVLAATPLPPRAGQRVSAEVLSHLSDLTEFENTLVLQCKSGEIPESDLINARSHIWSIIDSIDNNAKKNARYRLLVCMVSDLDSLDDHLAEMIYYWAAIVGISDETVGFAIEAEIARW